MQLLYVLNGSDEAKGSLFLHYLDTFATAAHANSRDNALALL